MRVALTGADGFLGSNVARELLKRGHTVCGLVHPRRTPVTLEELGIEIRRVDLLDPDATDAGINDCDAVIHTAASTAFWPPRSAGIWRINVDGTQNVLRAAQRAGVKRMVHVGTANSFAAGTKEHPGDETGPYTAGSYHMDYMDSKFHAHNIVLEAARSGDVPVVEVNPTFMWGPYDRVPGGGKIILRVVRGEVPGFSPGGKNCVSVKDVATATVNALTMGTIGESYIVGNCNMTYAEIFNTISAIVGKPVPQRHFPRPIVHLTGFLGSVSGVLSGREPRLSRHMAMISCAGFYYTPAKAVRELQMPQTPIDVAIREAYSWFVDNGYVYDQDGKLHRRLPMPKLA